MKWVTGIFWFLILILFIFLFFLSSCGENRYFKDVTVNRDSTNLLRYDIKFQTPDHSDAFITYWGKDNPERILYSRESVNRLHHNIRLINLKFQSEYFFYIQVKNREKIKKSNLYTFCTDSIAQGLINFDLIISKYMFPGYILLKKFHDPGALILINSHGDIIWYDKYDSTVVRPFDFTSDKHIISLVNSYVIEESDLYGDYKHIIDTRNDPDSEIIHHELFQNQEGNLVGLFKRIKIFDLSSVGGEKNDTIKGEAIFVMNKKGDKIWEWDMFKHESPYDYANINEIKRDWGHANSIAYDKDDNFLISFRDFNQIWKIDSYSGEIIWKLGENGDYKLNEKNKFIKQHTAHISPYGELIMFDNGMKDRGYSRIASYIYNNIDDVWEPAINIKLDEKETTFRMGSAYHIDENHILVCSPKKLLNLSIYTRSGELVWKLNGDFGSYRALYIPKKDIEEKPYF